MTFYDVLDLPETAHLNEIRAGFKRRAFAAHPDTHGGSDQALQEVLRAFDALSGQQSRARYDCWLAKTGSTSAPIVPTRCVVGFQAVKAASSAEAQLTDQLQAPIATGKARVSETPPETRAQRPDGDVNVFERLQSLLQELPRDRRRDVLTRKFSEQQRLALEEWMLAKQSVAPVHSNLRQDCHSRVPTPARGHLCQQRGRLAQGRLKRPQPPDATDDLLLRGQQQLEADSRAVSPEPCGQPTRVQGVVRIIRGQRRLPGQDAVSGGRIYYFACVTVDGGLRLLSRSDRDLRVALQNQVILNAIKQRIAEFSCTDDVAYEARFRAALNSTFDEFELTAVDVRCRGLRFLVSLRALWTGSPLRTRAFRADSELDIGLQAWRRLRHARGLVARHRSNVLHSFSPQDLEDDWLRLRSEYYDVMVQTGSPPGRVLSRLNVMERQHRTCKEKQAERWNQSRMAEEERLQRAALRHSVAQLQVKRRQETSCRQLQQAKRCAMRAEVAIQQLLRRWKRCHKFSGQYGKQSSRLKLKSRKRRFGMVAL